MKHIEQSDNLTAIIAIGSKQFKVTKGQTIFIDKQDLKVGDIITFDQVLLVGNDKDVQVGTPILPGWVVEGEIMDLVRGEKGTVFKKIRRKGFKKKVGYVQLYTQVSIREIKVTTQTSNYGT